MMTTQEREYLIDGQRVVVEARAWRVRLPFGGLVWNRPVAVRAPGPSGVTPGETPGETRLPVRDVTRFWQIAAYGVSLVCLAAGLLAGGRGRKE